MQKIQYPTKLRTVIILLLLSSGVVLMALLSFNWSVMPLFIYLIGHPIFLVYILCAHHSLLRSQRELQLLDGSIAINGKEWHTEDIDSIYIMGYFRQTIGIKPLGKRLVPVTLCFRYVNDEDQAIKALIQWAEHNGVAVRRKSFYVLI